MTLELGLLQALATASFLAIQAQGSDGLTHMYLPVCSLKAAANRCRKRGRDDYGSTDGGDNGNDDDDDHKLGESHTVSLELNLNSALCPCCFPTGSGSSADSAAAIAMAKLQSKQKADKVRTVPGADLFTDSNHSIALSLSTAPAAPQATSPNPAKILPKVKSRVQDVNTCSRKPASAIPLEPSTPQISHHPSPNATPLSASTRPLEDFAPKKPAVNPSLLGEDDRNIFRHLVNTFSFPSQDCLKNLNPTLKKMLKDYFKRRTPPCPDCGTGSHVRFRYFNNFKRSMLLQPRYTCRNPVHNSDVSGSGPSEVALSVPLQPSDACGVSSDTCGFGSLQTTTKRPRHEEWTLAPPNKAQLNEHGPSQGQGQGQGQGLSIGLGFGRDLSVGPSQGLGVPPNQITSMTLGLTPASPISSPSTTTSLSSNSKDSKDDTSYNKENATTGSSSLVLPIPIAKPQYIGVRRYV